MVRRDFVKIVIPMIALGPNVVFSQLEPEISFGVIADPQYADKEVNGTRFYRASLGKLKLAVDALNKEKLDFVVTLGDIIDQDFASYSDILPIYADLKTTHHLVLGNHDFDVADDDKNKVIARLGLDRSYYSVVQSGWRFIYLDGTEQSLFRYAEGAAEKKSSQLILDELLLKNVPQAKTWNGGIGSQQMEWLKQELEASKAAHEKVILCNHYPVLPQGEQHNLWNAETLVSLIDDYENVILYMNGHNHKGNYAVQKGTHYVNFKGMVETETESAYAIVDCYSDRVEIQGYGLEPDRVLS